MHRICKQANVIWTSHKFDRLKKCVINLVNIQFQYTISPYVCTVGTMNLSLNDIPWHIYFHFNMKDDTWQQTKYNMSNGTIYIQSLATANSSMNFVYCLLVYCSLSIQKIWVWYILTWPPKVLVRTTWLDRVLV